MYTVRFFITVIALAAALFVVVPRSDAVAQELPPGGTFIDDDGSVHEGFIEAVAAESITAGCNTAGTRYCPSSAVTRAQMATFLVRALGIPATGVDAFDDDTGTVHEPNINAVAAAGITSGCDTSNARRFCPEDPVTRGQMATFLVRALSELSPSSVDRFSDDDDSVHQANINGLADSGITAGCSTTDPSLYCPDEIVRRDQMATFLGRALDLTPNVPPARVGFGCTEVIGFSQTAEWYRPNGGSFEDTVNDAEWQLRWRSSSYIQLIATPEWAEWGQPAKSPCASPEVERVVLTISGITGSDVAGWASHITDAAAQVREQHPFVRQILLQPVVGGPNEGICTWQGQQIRASIQHPYIDQAIAQVAAAAADVEIGFSPEVPDCGGFDDNIGHLTDSYENGVGQTVGEFYAGLG